MYIITKFILNNAFYNFTFLGSGVWVPGGAAQFHMLGNYSWVLLIKSHDLRLICIRPKECRWGFSIRSLFF